MPLGAFYVETGRLGQRDFLYTLRMDDGGTWALDLGWRAARRARPLLGQRVVVQGTRAGFNLLDVRKLDPA